MNCKVLKLKKYKVSEGSIEMDIKGLGSEGIHQAYQLNNSQSKNAQSYGGDTRQNSENTLKDDKDYMPNIQEKMLINSIEKANKKFEGKDNELSFSVHEKTKQILVKIVDKQTKEVIKEIPPEKILDMIASMCEAAGIFVDEKR